MKKLVLSVVTTIAAVGLAAPAFAADIPMKEKAPAVTPPPSPFDVAFGVAFASDYVLRGISQTDNKPAVQGYFEADYTATNWLTLYAGLWGSNVSFADAEFDISGGGRFSWNNFGLDIGFVYYDYPSGGGISYGEFYAKPSYKITDWLSVGAQVIGGNNFSNGGNSAWYYAGNVTVTLPQFMPMGIGTSVSADLGRQTYASAIGNPDYNTWDAGVDFNYKAVTLDLRYYDTDLSAASCTTIAGAGDLCSARFVAMLKFDTSLSALK